MSTTTEGHRNHEAFYNDVIHGGDTKIIESDDNEAEAIPNIEIIPFVAHDAIDTDKFESFVLKPYDNLEKDYFASEKAKPFRYNNKFIQHSYDESADYVYTNPHERIDNGPYYFESNDNQFDSFSPPNEQDFLGKWTHFERQAKSLECRMIWRGSFELANINRNHKVSKMLKALYVGGRFMCHVTLT